jgi:heme-degrading monooxygenase HmoA
MFVVLSKFVVANDLDPEVREAFRARPHAVDGAPGFVRLDVLNPAENPKEFWLMTYWQDRASFEQWHRGHSYRQSHAGIPKGLKLVPNSATLTFFDHVAS